MANLTSLLYPISAAVTSLPSLPTGANAIGSVGVNNFPAVQPVSLATAPTTPVTGTFFQATQPVSLASVPSHPVTGPLTNTELRATVVPVSLASVPSHAVTGPLTDTELRATAVSVRTGNTVGGLPMVSIGFDSFAGALRVSATGNPLPVSLQSTGANATAIKIDGSGVTQPVSGPLTNTELRAAVVPVSLASVPSHPVTGSGSFTAAQATASSLKAQAQILDSAGSLLTYAATGTAGTPGVDVVSVQGVSSGVAIAVSGPVTDTQLRASAIPVSDRGSVGQATVTTFTSTSSLVLMASNSARKLLTVFNEGAGVLNLLYGAGTASTVNYSVRINSGDYLEIEKYTGTVTGIFTTAGTARVTEVS